MKKIALVSFRLSAKERAGLRATDVRRDVVRLAVEQSAAKGATHVVLPGWTFTYTDKEVGEHAYASEIDLLASLSKHHRTCILAEFTWSRGSKSVDFRRPPEGLGYVAFENGERTEHAIRNGERTEHAIRQVFTQGSAVAKRNDAYASVADDVFSGRRTLELGGVKFLLLVCGENNLLANVQSDLREKNRVILRHSVPEKSQTLQALREQDHDVVLNPAHTEMGNLGKHCRRWSWWSVPGTGMQDRYCFFNANVLRDKPGGAAIYGYHNGKKVLQSPWAEAGSKPFVVATCELVR